MKLREHKTLLGISFEGKRMVACVMHNSGSQLELRKCIRMPLSLEPLSSDPELTGREIRKHLDDAGIRANRCVVCVPLKWALSVQLEIPESDLSEEDVDSFITIQAEREFPFLSDELSLGVSRYHMPEGTERATIVALPANHLRTLQKVFKVAGLQPVSITLGVSSLLPPEVLKKKADGAVALLLSDNGIDLQITAGGGVIALRSFEEALETDRDGAKEFDLDMIASQLRITLGQLPKDLRETIRKVYVFGPEIQSVLDEMHDNVSRMGMTLEAGDSRLKTSSRGADGKDVATPGILTVTARRLLGHSAIFEFLPPKVSRFKQIADRVSARGIAWLACASVVLVVGLCGAFLFQSRHLTNLESEWAAISPKVSELETLQKQIREYRDWFDNSAMSLKITRGLVEAFPEDGAVWAKSIEIKGLSNVSCKGSARSNLDILKTQDALGKTPGVNDLKLLLDGRGDSPLQFSLTYKWNPGESNGK